MKLSRTLVLHIGRHKSGTSSLQHFLHANRDRLGDEGVLYPLSGSDNRIAHHALARACDPKISDGHELSAIVESLKTELREHHERILLSSEAFQNIQDISRLRLLVEALNIRNVHILCYVREHLDYAVSGFRQMVQNQARFVTFGQYVRRLTDMTPFVTRWQALGSLSLRWYDRDCLKDKDIIADFMDQLGLPPGRIPKRDMNPSIGGNLLVYKLAANRLGIPALSYRSLGRLAEAHMRFRSAFHIPDGAAARLRKDSAYNASLVPLIGEPGLKSWGNCPQLPQRASIREDLNVILPDSVPETRQKLQNAMEDAAAWFSLDY